MSQRQSRIVWGTLLGIVVLVCVGLSRGQGQADQSPAVETLLPAGAVLYVGFDGEEAHQEAFEKTAAHDALYKTGLMDVVTKFGESMSAVAQGPDAERMKALERAMEHVRKKGASLAITFQQPQPGGPPAPPFPQATVVLHESAQLAEGLTEMMKEAVAGEANVEEKEIDGRTVTGFQIPQAPPGMEISWWTEGTHLVIAAGLNAAQSTIAVAAGDAPNITADDNWKNYAAEKADFEVTSVAWLDLGALRERFGPMPIPIPNPNAPPLTVNQVLEPFGLDTAGTLVGRTGYKGRALWTESTLEAPGERRGLLSYWDRKPMTIEDLPPLPFGTAGFYACSVDWSAFYDDTITMIREAAALAPEQQAAQVEATIQGLPDILGFDPKAELFDTLGDVSCFYTDTRQGVLGLGSGFVCKVDDPETLRSTLTEIQARLAQQFPPGDVNIRTTHKHGREIVTFELARGMVNPSYAVDDDWLVIGLFPQTVEAFLLRVDGKLTNWSPTLTYRQGLAELPDEFVSIAAGDPRKSVRFMMGLAPVILPAIKLGLREARFPGAENLDVDVAVADLPPAEAVARPLFPNIAVCTVDEKGFHWTSRSSLPSVGPMGGVGVAAVGAALLLPAVQQARSAARRTSSKNNLRQIGLALHNYHDVYGEFPPGTHPNDDLKPEKRLSWQAKILPFIDQAPLFDRIDFDEAWDGDANKQLMKTTVNVYQNPGVEVDKQPEYGTTHYVGIAGIGKDAPTLPKSDKDAGVFGYDRKTRLADIKDGASNTIMVSEASKDYGAWGAGGSGTIRGFTKKPYINGPDGIGGPYKGGCNVLFCDGAVRFVSDNIDPTVLENLARMADGNPIPNF